MPLDGEVVEVNGELNPALSWSTKIPWVKVGSSVSVRQCQRGKRPARSGRLRAPAQSANADA